MIPTPSEAFEAVVRAGCTSGYEEDCIYPHCLKSEYPCSLIPPAIKAALAAALPPDPAPETKQCALWRICCGTSHCNAANHAPDHDISADGYAERYGCESKEMSEEFDRHWRAVRACLLPGEEPG